MIGLVDCQSFYASCERVFRPDLWDKPIVVLSNNDHWIIALSPEAKALGLKRGDRVLQMEPIIRAHGVFCCSSNYTLYSDMSRRVMITLGDLCPRVEPYSIDEAFIDLRGIENLETFAQNVRSTVFRQTFIPTSIGIGPTKSLAKIAQRLAKRGSGVLVLKKNDDVLQALGDTPIFDVWGIGRAYATFLANHGVVTARDFCNLPPWWVRKELTIVGWRLQQELRGLPCNDLVIEAPDRKAIVSARQFGRPVTSLQELHQGVAAYTEDAWQKLRSQDCTARILQVTLESSMLPGAGLTGKSLEFPEPTSYLPSLISAAKQLLDELFHSGHEYWRTTVLLFGIEPAARAQQDFFRNPNPRHLRITSAVEAMNRKYGPKTVRIAASQATEDWGMRRDFLSPRYTTRIEDFPVARLFRNGVV